MSWTLQVKDNADGTGATVVVSGTGSSYRVQRAVVAADAVGAYTTAILGPVVIPITAVVAGLDYYSWRVVDTSGSPVTLAGPVYQPATLTGDSVWNRCLIMIAERVASLGLPGLLGGVAVLPLAQGVKVSNGVVVTTLPKLNDLPRPVILCHATDVTEEKFTGTQPIDTDDILYPVVLEMIGETEAAETGNLENLRDRWLYNRERIDRAVDNQRWDLRVPEVHECKFTPGAATQAKFLSMIRSRVGSGTVKCTARMWRGAKKPTEP